MYFTLFFNLIFFYFKDLLANDDIKIDWLFRMSFANDIAKVTNQISIFFLFPNLQKVSEGLSFSTFLFPKGHDSIA